MYGHHFQSGIGEGEKKKREQTIPNRFAPTPTREKKGLGGFGICFFFRHRKKEERKKKVE